MQVNVVLLNWKAHAKIQALLKEKKVHLKKSLTSLLHQAIQLTDIKLQLLSLIQNIIKDKKPPKQAITQDSVSDHPLTNMGQ